MPQDKKVEKITALLHPGVWLIEADAGTGKTRSITDIAVFLLATDGGREEEGEPRLGARRLLLVTFTVAATAEMRERLRRRLSEAIAALRDDRGGEDAALRELTDCPPQKKRLRLERLLRAQQELDLVAVCTIHSFCQQVLLGWPEAARELAEGELMPDAGRLLEELVDDYLSATFYSDDEAASAGWRPDQPPVRKDLLDIAKAVCSDQRAELQPHQQGCAGDEPYQKFASWARSEYIRRLREYRQYTFDEMLLGVERALATESGEELAAKLRRRFGAVLVDEFQDTDPVQWNVFSRVWGRGGDDTFLFLIGDPKQSIYAFRGADVFVWRRAKKLVAAENWRTLDTNWRSDGRYVEALNGLFLRGRQEEEIFFDLPDFIALRRAAWPKNKSERLFRLRWREGEPAPAFVLRWLDGRLLPGGEKYSVVGNKGRIAGLLPALLAQDIASLLSRGAQVFDEEAKDWRPLRAGDVAVLARTNDAVAALAEGLRQAGIGVVTPKASSVFESQAAQWLEILLTVLIEPANGGALRALAATPWFGFSAEELHRGDKGEMSQKLLRLQADAAGWAENHSEIGFAGILQQVLYSGWLRQSGFFQCLDAERTLTDLRHLGELMQQAERENRFGLCQLLAWLRRMRENPPSELEAAALRLESDEDAVAVTTVHRSKGLQYGVVFLPDLWAARLSRKNKVLRFHPPGEPDAPQRISVGASKKSDVEAAAQREAGQESLRLLYVALTRARYQCNFYFAPAGQEWAASPAAWLLLRRPGETWPQIRERLQKTFAKKDGKYPDCRTLVEEIEKTFRENDAGCGQPLFVLQPCSLPERWERYSRPAQEQKPPGPARVFSGKMDFPWNAFSFSGMVRGQQLPKEEEADFEEEDEESLLPEPQAAPLEGNGLPLADLEKGLKAGNWLHRVFEKLDFQKLAERGISERDEELVIREARRQGIERSDQHRLLLDCLPEIVRYPFAEGGRALCHLPAADRLHETGFSLPLAGGVDWSGVTVSGEKMLRLAAAVAGREDLFGEEKPEKLLPSLTRRRLAGLLDGSIDMIFRLPGPEGPRYFLADFKSNYLGDFAEHYLPERLWQAMAHRHYWLQLAFYALACHRFLARRLPGYDCRRHFGGAYYLFLRAFSHRAGAQAAGKAGVLFVPARPEALQELSDLFDRGER